MRSYQLVDWISFTSNKIFWIHFSISQCFCKMKIHHKSWDENSSPKSPNFQVTPDDDDRSSLPKDFLEVPAVENVVLWVSKSSWRNLQPFPKKKWNGIQPGMVCRHFGDSHGIQRDGYQVSSKWIRMGFKWNWFCFFLLARQREQRAGMFSKKLHFKDNLILHLYTPLTT